MEVSKIKNITLRVDNDFHYSVKTYATNCGLSLQQYMIQTVEADLKAKGAYIKSPVSEMLDKLTDDDILELVKQIKEREKDAKK